MYFMLMSIRNGVFHSSCSAYLTYRRSWPSDQVQQETHNEADSRTESTTPPQPRAARQRLANYLINENHTKQCFDTCK